MESILAKIAGHQDALIRAAVVIAILLATYISKRFTQRLIERFVENSSMHIMVDPTQFALLRHVISALIYIAGIGLAIYMIPALKTMAVSIFAGAGVMAVVIGFASQKAFSNIISGIFIAIFQPFRVGDIIKFGDKIGVVEDINLRHTVIRNFQNKRYIVPNSVISEETIENFHIGEEKTCKGIQIGISYDADIDNAMAVMRREAMKHPFLLDTRTEDEKKAGEHPVKVNVVGLGDFSVNLKAAVWAKNPNEAYRMWCDLNKNIKEAFDREGIEIPYPYRTIVYKDDTKNKKSRAVKKGKKRKIKKRI